MTEQPKEPQAPFGININIDQIKQIAKYYTQWKWVAPIVGVKIPPELDRLFTTIASGKEPTPEDIQQLQSGVDASGMPERQVGEPVLTWKLAKDAYLMHQDGMGTREIAEEFTRQGNPCSHATVARWINDVEEMMESDRVAKFRQRIGIIVKVGAYIGLVAIGAYILHLFL